MPLGAARILASALAVIAFAVLPPDASSADPPSRSTALEKPRFASLEVEIWPEFDRPRAALVILKGELAPEIALPAALSLRIPASSELTAVAFATAPQGELFNLEHERAYADDFMTLRFKTSHRFIHVEFYDTLATDAPERRFSYVWPGDFAVDRMAVRVQEPAAARDFSARPDLASKDSGADGLLYRSAELGTVRAAGRLPIEIRYTKTDPRTSAEILGLKAADSKSPATAASSLGFPDWITIVAAFVVLLAGAGAAWLWWRRRAGAPAARDSDSGFCHQCGNRLSPGDRFCSKCGAPVH